jgi:imidazolonepropionase-like amidohydrolase
LSIGANVAVFGQSSGYGDWRWDPSVVRDDGSKSNLKLLGITKLTDGADAVLGAARNNLAGGGVTSERDPIESVQGTHEELSAMATATSQFGTISAVHAYHDDSVRNALEAVVVSFEHGNLMAEPETFEMVKKADAWVVSKAAVLVPGL